MTETSNIEDWSESDVREELVAPLLRRLGYGAGSQHRIVRELSLRYPRAFVGRHKPNTDPPLRARADYICEADQRIRWVVEAKAPNEDIGTDELDQAFSYAAHPEVRAVYFCVTNGRRLVLHRTSDAPESQPLIDVDPCEGERAFQELRPWVSPEALLREFPTTDAPPGDPVAPGFRSVAKVVNGNVIYLHPTRQLPLHGMRANIDEGTIQRDDGGGLIAYLKISTPFESMNALNRRIGLDETEYRSTDVIISADPARPTTFASERKVRFPKGERLLDIHTWRSIQLSTDVECKVKTIGTCHIESQIVKGNLEMQMAYINGATIKLLGTFELRIV